MNPQQSSGDFNQQQYDFITNPGKPKRPSPLAGVSKSRRIMIVAGGGFLVLIVIVVLLSVIFSGPSDREQLLAVAQKQSQLIEMSENAKDSAVTSDTLSLAAVTKTTMSTDQSGLLTRFDASAKEIAKGIDSDIEQELANAQQNGQYDVVFEGILSQELAEYEKLLQDAFEATNSKKTKDALSGSFDNANTIISFVDES